MTAKWHERQGSGVFSPTFQFSKFVKKNEKIVLTAYQGCARNYPVSQLTMLFRRFETAREYCKMRDPLNFCTALLHTFRFMNDPQTQRAASSVPVASDSHANLSRRSAIWITVV